MFYKGLVVSKYHHIYLPATHISITSLYLYLKACFFNSTFHSAFLNCHSSILVSINLTKLMF